MSCELQQVASRARPPVPRFLVPLSLALPSASIALATTHPPLILNIHHDTHAFISHPLHSLHSTPTAAHLPSPQPITVIVSRQATDRQI